MCSGYRKRSKIQTHENKRVEMPFSTEFLNLHFLFIPIDSSSGPAYSLSFVFCLFFCNHMLSTPLQLQDPVS